MKKFSVLLFLLLLMFGGCSKVQPQDSSSGNSEGSGDQKGVRQTCIQACQKVLEKGKDLSDGPCLLDPMQNSKRVCDVGHEPRQSVDNKRKNQCDAWHKGTASHFIEVTPECEFIKKK